MVTLSFRGGITIQACSCELADFPDLSQRSYTFAGRDGERGRDGTRGGRASRGRENVSKERGGEGRGGAEERIGRSRPVCSCMVGHPSPFTRKTRRTRLGRSFFGREAFSEVPLANIVMRRQLTVLSCCFPVHCF